MRTKPELLSPAGDFERLQMAVAFGADAVYLAGERFGMRGGVKNFSPEEMAEAVRLCHSRGVRVHVTCNTLPRGDELPDLPDFLAMVQETGADVLIVADLGVFRLAQREAPRMELHVSTQTGIVNSVSASSWYDLGAKRVVLAREMSLKEITQLRDEIPDDLEIETFVHGSMCVSFSGRCLLSNYMTGRDGNRGICAQPCRWKYALVEETRPGEYFPIGEDRDGTYILNSKDLCMIDHIPELLDAGIDSFKIEGRAKSSYYTAVTTNAYQNAIRAAMEGKPLDPVWLEEVEKVSHRHYYTGFYYGYPGDSQYYESSRYIRDWQVSAYVISDDGERALCTQRNRFSEGDELELLVPGQAPVRFTARDMKDEDGNSLTVLPHPEQRFTIPLPVPAKPDSIIRRSVNLSAK
ncbi:MAG: U32 family peptidase [Oscillospiraceae bacterium]|nr:U32 family peptidase [Oscillospiraceae bacterium]